MVIISGCALNFVRLVDQGPVGRFFHVRSFRHVERYTDANISAAVSCLGGDVRLELFVHRKFNGGWLVGILLYFGVVHDEFLRLDPDCQALVVEALRCWQLHFDGKF